MRNDGRRAGARGGKARWRRPRSGAAPTSDRTALPLQGIAVLVAEDEYYQADETRRALEGAGAAVLGPCWSAANALAAGEPDCAVLDINLGAGADFALARVLAGRGVPLVLLTGYDEDTIPIDLSLAAHLRKPAAARQIVAAVRAQLGAKPDVSPKLA